MTEQEQHIAISEACGWNNRGLASFKTSYKWHRYQNGKRVEWSNELPDYLHDLNAMHEAEKILGNDIDNWLRYDKYLAEGQTKFTWFATASQRAEAFLRTIDKWKD